MNVKNSSNERKNSSNERKNSSNEPKKKILEIVQKQKYFK